MLGIMLVPLAVMAPPQSAPAASDPAPRCPPAVVTASTPKPPAPMRKLNEEPPAALIAAVDVRHDGCSVMLVLAPGESGLDRGWTPAPGGSMSTIE
jgi:hypothetical protein